MTIKEHLHKMIDDLPDENTVKEMQERLYVFQKVRRGLASIDAGKGIDHMQVASRTTALGDDRT